MAWKTLFLVSQKEYLDAVKLMVIEEQVIEKGKYAPVDRYKRMN